jgi:hypothetical protein
MRLQTLVQLSLITFPTGDEMVMPPEMKFSKREKKF